MKPSGKTRLHTQYKDSEGNVVPSVTSIIGSQLGWNKNALINWTKKLVAIGEDPEKVRDKSADIGTLAHYLIECDLKGLQPNIGDFSINNLMLAQNAYNAFKKWWDDKNFKFYKSECVIVSEEYKYGGTIDLLARRENDIYLIDFKTSGGIYPEHLLQVSAYEYAYSQEIEPIKEVYILQLSKQDDSFSEHYISREQLNLAFEAFLHCISLAKIQSELKV